jgi:uncharacterized protein (TIGR00369 family)
MPAERHPVAPPRISAPEFERLVRERVSFGDYLEVSVEELAAGRARLRMPFRERLLRPGGTIGGPALMALADIALYGVVLSLVGRVELAVTTSLNFNFLRRPRPADVVADGRILKLGRRLAVGEVALYSDGLAEPVAHATGTYAIPPDAPARPVP